MTAIARTAYPSFKQRPTAKELAEVYTPTPEEIEFVRSRVKTKNGLLRLMTMLKSFQRLGYFPRPEDVPPAVIAHLRSCLKLHSSVSAMPSLRSRRYYQEEIRAYLGVKPYDRVSHELIATVIAKAAQVKNYTVDLINIAIEELVKERYELPAFSTLDRLAGHVLQVANTRLFQRISKRLTPAERTYLDGLLLPEAEDSLATLNLLKTPPQNATLSHIQQLQAKFDQLLTFGNANRLLSKLPLNKIKSFAAQAKALDISEMQDIKHPKRRTLLLCLLYRAQVKTRDYLVDMFLKRIKTIENKANNRQVELREKHLTQTETFLQIFVKIVQASNENPEDAVLGQQVKSLLEEYGGLDILLAQCKEVTTYNSRNYLPLMGQFYSRYRKVLFDLVRSLDIRSASQDKTLMNAVSFILEHQSRRSKWLPTGIDLSFASSKWRQLILSHRGEKEVLIRQQLEICVFTSLATALKTGDAYVVGSENYADFREQLLSWEECGPQLEQYCQEMGFPTTPEAFVQHFKTELTQKAAQADQICKSGEQVTISEKGDPVLKRVSPKPVPPGATALEKAILQRLPERGILDILCNTEHWFNWTRHFGPVSGSEPKLEKPIERYILTTFGYGCNLGPNETARHTRGLVTSHMLSYINRRHVDTPKIEAAVRDIINGYKSLNLPRCWGSGKTAAADGSKFEVYENNLLSEYHIRYGGYGGIGYYHVSDTYIALFNHFIPCGVYEGVFILDGFLKNLSEIQPDTLHADTHGQSGPAFGLAILLGIKLMPRIRGWDDYTFLRPSKDEVYEYLDPLFKDVVNWKLIQDHWKELMQIALSIKAGKLMPSTLLRKLNSHSSKNRLHQALEELGRVGRTIFLLKYISDPATRQQITACTNIVEGYHKLLDWLFFGKNGAITENDPEEQEKRLKYLDLVASAVIFQNAVDISLAVQALSDDGYPINQEDLATMSPYIVQKHRRYGDLVVDMDVVPHPFEQAISLPIEVTEI
jgi:TnpA family transposase